ncbi:LytTR family DNA-binding domain-containing protein [Mucilaginibacter sp. OK283]|jgi:DNA-binding LytR/AlgR family response regulator|uniref:LytR/AlgR family response regulator transcription factor n=1 Tax=Mucilaginibacter sp. OK283 TaxID=1881049 RepID=UPI0008CC7BF3|nr:LytTR family DNA-binding domain-containing protein [Mucilaginibacter sp. OK283]SEP41524.1 two component transcriptional regulator, LytTR family [Mucilaginibacter sp. OK283]
MSSYKCIIIDDEPYAIEGLKKYINEVPHLKLLNCYTDPVEALLGFANMDIVDLVFMDVEMPRITGLELAKAIRQQTHKLIVTTAHTRYGYEAFEVAADAYLLKPYTFFKFAATIAKLFPKAINGDADAHETDDFFFVKNKNDNLKIVKIKYAEVVAVESKQNYVMIHTTSKKVMTYMSLKEISQVFNRITNFVQFQRSFILSKDHIESIDGNTIKMTTGLDITVGDYYRKNFAAFMAEKLIKAGRKD